MATTLGTAIDADQTVIETNDDDLITGKHYPVRVTIESEVLYVIGAETVGTSTERTRWSVQRGADDTTAASHAINTAISLTPLGSGAGGAALTVDNGTDPPAEVTGIVAPGAVIAGGEAAFPARFYAQTTDPGAVGAGAVWKDTTLSGSSTKWWERNAANDGWDAFAVRRTVSTGDDPSDASTYAATTGSGNAAAILRADAGGDGGANASATAATTGGGEADASSNAIAAAGGDAYASSYAETVDGAADASLTAESSGEGDANVEATATATTGEATAGSVAVRGAVTAGMSCVVDATSGRMAFNGETPIAKPTGVAVTAEAIHAALVSLGLIAS